MSDWKQHEAGGIAYAERAGPGPVLVLLHGIGSWSGSFAPLAPHLPADWRVIAWDAPGYGRSTAMTPAWPRAADYAAALARLLEALDLPRILLAGHSLGALMAASYAADRPGHVARMLLAAPALGHGVPQGGALSVAAQDRIDALHGEGPEIFAAARAPRLVHQPQSNPEVVARVYDAMARVSLPGYGQAARMLASGRLLDDLARIEVPTDVITGAEDVVTPPEGARRAHEALPEAMRGAYTEVPGAGHALYQQAPGAFARALAALATRHGAPDPEEDRR